MKSWLTMTAAVSCMLAVSGAALGAGDDIAREGAGDRRARLDSREMTAFPSDLWTGLQSWAGTPVTAEETSGKVVVIVTWASWARASHDALRAAQQIQDRYGDKGVVVVGVHHKDGFDGAAKVAEGKGVSFAYAHDADGSFRSGLEVDQDPDVYVIDRAGNLRFADIETTAAEGAVRALVGETAEEAAARPQNLADKAAQAEAARRKTKPVDADLVPGRIVDVPFTMPDAEAYAKRHWPATNTDQLHAGDFQGKPLPAALGNETWLFEKPSMNGRIVVLDFWATWCGPCKAAMPGLDALQKAHPHDLVIIGMSGNPRGESYKEDPSAVKRFLRSHKSAYYHANDLKQTIYSALQVRGIPHVVVLSTDGVIRWQGMPSESGFRTAVEQCINQDPGVKARREAEKRRAG